MIFLLLALGGFFYSCTNAMDIRYSDLDSSYIVTINCTLDAKPILLKAACWELSDAYLYAEVTLYEDQMNEPLRKVGTVLVPRYSGVQPVITSHKTNSQLTASNQRILMSIAENISSRPLVIPRGFKK